MTITNTNDYTGSKDYKSRPVSEKFRKIVENYGAGISNYSIPIRHGDSRDQHTSFTPYEDCSLEQKQEIREKEAKILEIKENPNEDYDKIGRVSIPVFEKNSEDIIYTLDIDITPRELAEAGILPSDLEWKPLEKIKEEQKQAEAKVSSKSILEAEKMLEQGLTTTEVGGFKGFIKKILDKFKGKGEK